MTVQSPFDDSGAQDAAARFGMWVFLGSEAMLFGALLLVYALMRIEHGEGFGAASNELSWRLGALNTAVLLTSSLCMALAHEASIHTRRAVVSRWLAATLVLGLVFLAIKGFEYREEYRQGLMPLLQLGFAYAGPDPRGAEYFFSLYFALTGLHALHLAVGLLAIVWLLAGRRTMRMQVMRNIGLYWHFVDMVWVFLFPLLYLVAR
jgi:cytochrome c oxidase subunit 3